MNNKSCNHESFLMSPDKFEIGQRCPKCLRSTGEEEIAKIREYTYKINDLLKEFFLKSNLKLIDFKIEFGNYHGQVVLADEISPDTCRLWDATTNEKMDKDRFRRDLGNVEETYREVLARITKQ